MGYGSCSDVVLLSKRDVLLFNLYIRDVYQQGNCMQVNKNRLNSMWNRTWNLNHVNYKLLTKKKHDF